MWFEQFQFEKNPYEKLDPYQIDLKYLGWDRPDLEKARADINKFIDDAISKRRVALQIFGSSGSGKTWLTRIIEKEMYQKDKDIVFLYTKIPRVEPTFQIVYGIAIRSFFEIFFNKLKEHVNAKFESLDIDAWMMAIADADLAQCFTQLSSGTNPILAKKWLTGDKLSVSELKDLKVTDSIDSDYKRLEMLRKLIRKLSTFFSTIVLVVDELENAPVKFAGQLNDGLRDMLDTFSEKFALMTLFTAQKVELWYDLGYTDALQRRFDYTIELDSVKKEIISKFLRLHQEVYRKSSARIKDQLYPFNEQGILALLELMSPDKHYPGFLLPNCEYLVRTAAEKKTDCIDEKFVRDNAGRMPFK